MSALAVEPRRGMPLAIMALMLGAWMTGRAVLWESPFRLPKLDAGELLFAETAQGRDIVNGPVSSSLIDIVSDTEPASAWAAGYRPAMPGGYLQGYSALGHPASIAAGHQMLMSAALQTDWHSGSIGRGLIFGENAGLAPGSRSTSAWPSSARFVPGRGSVSDRWALEAFAFFRAGSSSLSTSQGRVPVYGANQLAAKLQYRIAPRSGHDPRAFLRAYHAVVADPETEIAAGLSARPLANMPLRLAGELRAVRGTAGTDLRPAGYVVTEFAPHKMPLGFSLETYAAAGYVGGEAETYFVDGQASLARELVSVDGPGERPMRLSVGGAAWGGAQEDAQRLDVGPSMRLDLSLGQVPARVSVDWRQRVAGDAAPDSGVAATVSTRF
ncbi:MAG: hypothetical protein ACX930_06470 [Erythrobacter sp.]